MTLELESVYEFEGNWARVVWAFETVDGWYCVLRDPITDQPLGNAHESRLGYFVTA